MLNRLEAALILPLVLFTAAFFFVCGISLPSGYITPDTEETVLGDERMEEYLPLLEGERVALFCNHTAIVGDIVDGLPSRQSVDDASADEPFIALGSPRLGTHLLDSLLHRGVDVTAVFSPEHGFRGDAGPGEKVAGGVDSKTGVPLISLYGSGKNTLANSADRFDVLVIDIQDVGLRFYTYYITMQRLLRFCAENGKKVILLDRPNPNGFLVDGPVLDMTLKSGVGSIPVPVLHGMTFGELALMMNGEGWASPSGSSAVCDLTVIPCLGYDHSMKYRLIVPPSPNLKTMKAVYLYSSTCFFEGVTVTPGHGTSFSFEVYGHPSMIAGDFYFTPRSIPGAKSPRYQDMECRGVDLRGKTLEQIWSEGLTFEYVCDACRNMDSPGDFFLPNGYFDKLAGQKWVREMILSGADPADIKARWADDVEAFLPLRSKYLLYK